LEEGKKIMHFNRRKRLKSNKHYLLRKKKLWMKILDYSMMK
jgi:hypothetical protein